jgi:hypothetical protein
MHSPTVSFDAATGVIAFSVSVAGKAIACRVSAAWLHDAYGDEPPLDIFNRRRANVEAAALRAWLASRGTEPVQLKREHVWRQGAGEKVRAGQPG